jgi:hypothetical protein
MRAFLVLLFVLAFRQASAETPIAVTGFGSVTCAHFAEDYRKNPDTAELLYYSWAQGYMSGQNVVLAEAKKSARNLGAFSTKSQKAMLRTYCDGHPLGFFWLAVVALFESLPQVQTDQ